MKAFFCTLSALMAITFFCVVLDTALNWVSSPDDSLFAVGLGIIVLGISMVVAGALRLGERLIESARRWLKQTHEN